MAKLKEQEEVKTAAQEAVLDVDQDILALFKAGAHFGHHKSKWNPKMEPFVFGIKNKIHIVDLVKTKEKLDEALEFLKAIVKNDGQILFVGTKRQTKQIVEDLAKECKMPYVTSRWIGGTFTNNKVISSRIKKMDDLEAIVNDPEAASKYKKQEISIFKKEIERINGKLGGLRNLKGFPAAMFIFDITEDKPALEEAKSKGIPVVALVDTNADPNLVDFPIPSNDDAIAVIKLMAEFIKKAIAK